MLVLYKVCYSQLYNFIINKLTIRYILKICVVGYSLWYRTNLRVIVKFHHYLTWTSLYLLAQWWTLHGCLLYVMIRHHLCTNDNKKIVKSLVFFFIFPSHLSPCINLYHMCENLLNYHILECGRLSQCIDNATRWFIICYLSAAWIYL